MKQTKLLRTRLERIFTLLTAESVNDITPHGVQIAMGTIRGEGVAVQTCNHTLRAVKQFTRWLLRDGRITVDPILHLKTSNAETDRRYERRALDEDELSRLVAVAETCPSVLGVSGIDRAMAYRVATGTGFRLGELKSLCPENFDLDSDPPTVAVSAAYSKHRRRDVQPIRIDLAEIIRPWLENKAAGESVFQLPDKAARMINVDLRCARARWIKEVASKAQRRLRLKTDFLKTTDHDNRVCDFHALRHTYITRLVRSGASVKVCQDLARHSTPMLTIGRYAHTRLHDLTHALDSLPVSGTPRHEVAALQATGTDNSCPFPAKKLASDPQQNPQQSGRFSQRLDTIACESEGEWNENAQNIQATVNTEVSNVAHRSARLCDIATGRIRTDDLRFTKPLLC
ncbi:MAG: site-specific integrase, partial [Planctomycetota bacterium]